MVSVQAYADLVSGLLSPYASLRLGNNYPYSETATKLPGSAKDPGAATPCSAAGCSTEDEYVLDLDKV